MRRHKFRLALCLLGLTAVLAGGALAAGGGDSLVSLSYLMETFLPKAQSRMEEINDSALEEAYNQAAGLTQGEAGSGLYSADFQSRTFSPGDLLTLPTGSGVVVYAGTAEVAHSGAVIDVTDGTAVPSGTRLLGWQLAGEPVNLMMAGACALIVLSVFFIMWHRSVKA